MKLTGKLILSFLLVSILSTGIVVAATRFSTDREFDTFLNLRFRFELAEELAWYYDSNQSWDGINESLGNDDRRFGMMHGQPNRAPSIFITDKDGVIVAPAMMQRVGESIGKAELAKGTPILVEGETVGFLFITENLMRSSVDRDFLHRVYRSILISAGLTTLFALLIGILLSNSITRPIRELIHATKTMKDNNLGGQVPVRSSDEIGELARSFNQMSADLARSFELRKQMTADIAHELRTPLSLILGHAEGVKDGVLKPTRKNFEIIREEAQRLESLVKDLRTLSLADAGELKLEFQPSNVNELLSAIHIRHLTLFDQKRITLNLETSPEILTASLDPNRFTQVINNILENALRHTHENGSVTVSLKPIGEKIRITIKDSGDGVTAEEAARLFDRFYRVDQSRTRDDGGSGLGLAIARSIIDMHHGKIWAESEPGQGVLINIEITIQKHSQP